MHIASVKELRRVIYDGLVGTTDGKVVRDRGQAWAKSFWGVIFRVVVASCNADAKSVPILATEPKRSSRLAWSHCVIGGMVVASWN